MEPWLQSGCAVPFGGWSVANPPRPDGPIIADLPIVACGHRQAAIGEGEATLCGFRGTRFLIFGCAKHGRCTMRRFCQRQSVRSCVTCIVDGENE